MKMREQAVVTGLPPYGPFASCAHAPGAIRARVGIRRILPDNSHIFREGPHPDSGARRHAHKDIQP
ncbi:hypothetical protein ACVDG3_13560 [Meridianimarinicoccus sp. RP-17]|uniref:hypothetical protein n=1 Tax=Meridianimarinicoccus zhengii TaxID=2056810 RepID=UPI0013A6ADC1|nr:hypothetical protein [Phycocomes zhengii]